MISFVASRPSFLGACPLVGLWDRERTTSRPKAELTRLIDLIRANEACDLHDLQHVFSDRSPPCAHGRFAHCPKRISDARRNLSRRFVAAENSSLCRSDQIVTQRGFSGSLRTDPRRSFDAQSAHRVGEISALWTQLSTWTDPRRSFDTQSVHRVGEINALWTQLSPSVRQPGCVDGRFGPGTAKRVDVDPNRWCWRAGRKSDCRLPTAVGPVSISAANGSARRHPHAGAVREGRSPAQVPASTRACPGVVFPQECRHSRSLGC